MDLTIRKTNLSWSEPLAKYVERRTRRGLKRVGERVRSVLVKFADVNGPRGGDDKECAVAVRLDSGQEIVVQSRDACAYRAVDGAVSRAQRIVRERAKRNRDRRRRRVRS